MTRIITSNERMMTMAREKQFENKIKEYLKSQGCYFIKYWGGGEFTKAGVPDILCCCDGFFIGIEVKAEKGKPSALQIHNLEQIGKAGGFGLLVYPKDFTLFKNLIECIKKMDCDNMMYNYSIFKHNILEWKKRLDA